MYENISDENTITQQKHSFENAYPIYDLYVISVGSFLSFGLVGNSIVIIYFGFVRKCKKNYELLIMILGISDFLASLGNFVFTWSIIVKPSHKWKLGGIMCNHPRQILLSTNESTSYILAMMFYVRYRCIADPLSNKITKLKIIVVSLIIFGIAILLRVPTMFRKFDGFACFTNIKEVFGSRSNAIFYAIMRHCVLRFFVPFIAMICWCYQTKKSLQKAAVTLNNEMINARNKRVLKTTIALLAVFGVSVGIAEFSRFCYLIKIARNEVSVNDVKIFSNIFILFFINSSVNVIVYAGFMPEFRKFCYKVINLLSIMLRMDSVQRRILRGEYNTKKIIVLIAKATPSLVFDIV